MGEGEDLLLGIDPFLVGNSSYGTRDVQGGLGGLVKHVLGE